ASNHLRIVDGGMTQEERSIVLERYSAFADRINAARRTMQRRDAGAQRCAGRIRLALEDNDIVQLRGGVQGFNWRTQNRWQAPAGLGRLVERAAAIGPTFTSDELSAGATRTDAVAFLVDELVRRDVFVPAT